ncbi:ribosome biogenesis/translation initiation ATPase RLI [Candidatus Bathyarchaeota archaeon]|nr:ribosome biogenesis/translation initiation ATPase RLI [Candidatus Bathyarchaeota archaeon]
MRVAVIDLARCKSKRCSRECYRFCPQVRSNVEAVRFEGNTPVISEILCVGCGICVKKCPYNAISIVNVPDELQKDCSHRFGPNTFKLFRIPVPSSGNVLGLIGKNGIGKSTVLKILAGEIKPNLGEFSNPPDWPEIIKFFRGSTLQTYFQRMSEGKLRVVHKPQYVDKIPKVTSGKVNDLLEKVDERGKLAEISKTLQLEPFLDREISVLSGGELQRVAIAATICREADVYLFDEPSSYLDVKQRIEVAKAIRSLKQGEKMIVLAEHDLAVLDYLSDYICVLYGEPGVYGIVSHVHGVRTGINLYLEGFIPDENMRFRKEPIIFHVKPPPTGLSTAAQLVKWGSITKNYEGFSLKAEPGEARQGEVVGIVGSNGIGKTTFIKILAGMEKPDSGDQLTTGLLEVSYKPQYISSDFDGTIEDLLKAVAKQEYSSGWYQSEIMTPLNLAPLLDRQVKELSGGELQRVAIAACLSRKADVYLLDEPSAYLDVEERLIVARTIRRIVDGRNVTAFVVEHDVVAQDFIADRLMVFTGEPGKRGLAKTPTNLLDGMNMFLKEMGITFRRDPDTKRPRVNKEGSQLDIIQKETNQYYYIK